MKNTIASLVDKIVYYGYSNGMCYSGELIAETIHRKTRYVIKRAISIQFPDYGNNYTIYINEDKIEKIVGPNIYIKQEKDMNTEELRNSIIMETLNKRETIIVDENIVAPF